MEPINLISFDIGIKNMAYCIFKIHNNSITIEDWNVINLLQDNNPVYKCNCIIPPKTKKDSEKICNKNAKFTKNSNYFCEKHAKSSKQFIIPNKTNTKPFLKKCKVDQLNNIACSHFLNTTSDDKKLKKDELIDLIFSFYNNRCYENIIKTKQNANNIDLINIGKKIKEFMNLIPNINNVNKVIIENQISPIANRMKTIQGMLAQYFIMINNEIDIDFVSSANKLKQFFDLQHENTDKKTYKENKKDGVFYSELFIKNNLFMNNWHNRLDTKKKDDLADAFLQGIWYLKKENILYYADDLKIYLV